MCVNLTGTKCKCTVWVTQQLQHDFSSYSTGSSGASFPARVEIAVVVQSMARDAVIIILWWSFLVRRIPDDSLNLLIIQCPCKPFLLKWTMHHFCCLSSIFLKEIVPMLGKMHTYISALIINEWSPQIPNVFLTFILQNAFSNILFGDCIKGLYA